jgi:hypothetical protein
MDPTIVSKLLDAGLGGVVLATVFYVWKLKSADQENLLTRFDKIVDRIVHSEESNRNQIMEMAALNRKQVGDLSDQSRGLFDRVITVCTTLGSAIQELSANTKANERALIELSANTKAQEKAILELSASTRANEKAIQDLRNEVHAIAGPAVRKALGQDDPPPFVAR